ncbi:hypothetical protein POM88_052292 [Heracleum sosnowskyi]|uniref:Uncharacterized protein n=1 Tax=Heracleum sosnowskyi TaxID=360622 RepID=A0AAD8LZD6_9APIA|nr:hypothetical protein POM88_052292 [Heracleum sosnowskyi]
MIINEIEDDSLTSMSISGDRPSSRRFSDPVFYASTSSIPQAHYSAAFNDFVSLLIGKLQGTQISITLGGNQQPPPPPPLRTLRELLTAILEYCFENPTISIPLLIFSFLGYQSYSWGGTGLGGNSTG